MQKTVKRYSLSVLRAGHVRNSDSEAFDIHFYNLKLEKMSTIVKSPLIRLFILLLIFFIENL